jgi:hypothetical protein
MKLMIRKNVLIFPGLSSKALGTAGCPPAAVTDGMNRLLPPPFGFVVFFFLLSQLQDFVGRIAQNTVEHTTAGVFSVFVSPVGQAYHLTGQFNGLFYVLIAGFYQVSTPERWAFHTLLLIRKTN